MLRGDHPQEFGINLMACYFIVYHQGGAIEVKSNRPRGNEFIITFPQDPPEETEQEPNNLQQILLNQTRLENLRSEL